ncbi:acyltransferase [Streptomyces sp. NA04227]|uniref:acyltransferase family protein n=1 Tax=Streptomyces sp. NA04227 TaxID=2742136 RepID=UPI00158FB0E4|nr:acyltransferase [Streptomyces sp. NA04227]QKW06798.1 acyltransferase [Streptomyces sp. NA04227]
MSSQIQRAAVPETVTGEVGEASPAPVAAPPARDRYFDLLRFLALLRVTFYHLLGWGWLSLLFPSMGVMFALAGSLMARSLERRPAAGVIRARLRRLLPPLWAFGALMLALLFAAGWNTAPEGGSATLWDRLRLGWYLLPFGAPPYPLELGGDGGLLEATWAEQAAGPLWYLRAYLWFLLASPLLLWCLRRFPWPTLLAPLALTAVVGTSLVEIPGETGNAVTDFAVYGGCWVLGMGHRSGPLRRMPPYLAVSLASLLMGLALWWASGHRGPDGWDLNDIPLAQAAWSFGFVVILLTYAPMWNRLPGRLARWDRLVTLANNRAVTIYLWHNLLILATVPLIDRLYGLPFATDGFTAFLDSTYTLWMCVFLWPLLALTVLATGWVEDLAAKRRPRLWPDGRVAKARRRSARR